MTHPLHPPTPGDEDKARTTRLVRATRHLEERPGQLTPEERDQIAAWVQEGGTAPWDKDPQTGGQSYPPQEPERGPRA